MNHNTLSAASADKNFVEMRQCLFTVSNIKDFGDGHFSAAGGFLICFGYYWHGTMPIIT